MIKQMRFGIEETAARERLTIDIPESVLEKARDKDALLVAKLGTLARQKVIAFEVGSDGSRKVAVNAKAIGRRGLTAKLNSLERINDSLDTLLTSAEPEEFDPALNIISYTPLLSGDFGFAAEITLPQVDRPTMAEVAKRHMVTASRNLQMLSRSSSAEGYEALIGVDVSDEEGISLSQSTHSSIHTMAESYRPGSTVVELWDNNVIPGPEPIVYLVGVTALAHADKQSFPILK